MKSRRKAREAALQALYQCETLSDWTAGAIQRYFENFHKLELASLGTLEGSLRFCLELIEGVILHGTEVDEVISAASDNWSLGRMSQVDRTILRIACFEFCFMEGIPFSVTMNEALELAKTFSADDSPKFVNGVLDRITKTQALTARFPAFAARFSVAAA